MSEQALNENTEAEEYGQEDPGEVEQETQEQRTNTNTESLLAALEDGEGITFDFSTGEQPEGFPDDFWDAENNTVNAQALYDSYRKQEKIAKDLRSKMGRGEHKPPEKPDAYKFEASERAAQFIKEGDPLVGAAREIAHKHGLSQEQFSGFMAEITDRMVDIQAELADENSPANEIALEQYRQEEIKKIGPNGPQVLRAVESWAKELHANGTLSEQDVQTLVDEGLTSARMVQMFNRLRSRMGGQSIPVDSFDDGLPPDREIAQMLSQAYESGNEAAVRKVEQLLDKRRAAGRPERLAT